MRVAALLFALALVLGCAGDEEAPVRGRPPAGLNVVVVSFDALRADALGVYGSPLGASPHVDRWAERAIVFENAWAVSPVTPTSFASLFSGRPPLEVFRDWRFDPRGSLAPSFAAAGYATGAFLHNPQLVRQRGFQAGFGRYVVEERVDGRLDAVVLARALGWMRRQTGPFLAWIHLLDPHAAWDRRALAERFYDPDYRGRYVDSGPSGLREEDPVELARLRSLYTGEVFVADHHFATLLDGLEEAGLLGRTILLLTADHGEGLMDHGLLQHAQVYEEDLRVPMILALPGASSGRRVRAPVTQLDVLPTLAALAGVPAPASAAGRDLTRPLPPGQGVVGVAYTDSRFRQASLLAEDGAKLVVECGERVAAGRPRRQLFDLRADPGERRDLAPRRGARADALEDRLWTALGVAGCEELAMRREGARSAHEGLDPETVKRLEALGYGAQQP